GELCDYQKRVASKKWILDLGCETLALTPNHGFILNASNQPVYFKRAGPVRYNEQHACVYNWKMMEA
ncbi:hypothetical protein RYX36_002517, partial [Vicia faba]